MLQAITIFVAALPALALAGRFAWEGLGPDPIEDLTHVSGEWALRWLLACLAVTPARRLFGLRKIAPLRRTLGLAAFCYAVVHVSTWSVLDRELELAAIVEDLTERPYVMAGMSAFLLLVPLAVTSTRGWIKRLGQRWVRLHRLVYAAAALAILHFAWSQKADLLPAIVHGAVLAVLLGVRIVWWRRERAPAA